MGNRKYTTKLIDKGTHAILRDGVRIGTANKDGCWTISLDDEADRPAFESGSRCEFFNSLRHLRAMLTRYTG